MGRAFEYRRASKEKRWDKMSKVFPKLARSITIAAKSGGSDPESNSALRTAISNAKAVMTEASIRNAKAQPRLDSVPWWEWKGAKGQKAPTPKESAAAKIRAQLQQRSTDLAHQTR